MAHSESDQSKWVRNNYTNDQGRTPSGTSTRQSKSGNTIPVTGPETAQNGNYYIYLEATGLNLGDKAV